MLFCHKVFVKVRGVLTLSSEWLLSGQILRSPPAGCVQVLAGLSGVGSSHAEAVLSVLRARREEIHRALLDRTNSISFATLQDFDWQLKVTFYSGFTYCCLSQFSLLLFWLAVFISAASPPPRTCAFPCVRVDQSLHTGPVPCQTSAAGFVNNPDGRATAAVKSLKL